MKQTLGNLCFYGFVIIMVMMISVIFYSICVDKSDKKQHDVFSSSAETLFLRESKKIIDYKNGVNQMGKKRMLLAIAAKLYHEEVCDEHTSTIPVISVVYLSEYRGNDIFWIAQGSPSDFSYYKNISSVDCAGEYVVLYCLKDMPIITYDYIRQMGFDDETDSITVQELSWFMMINPTNSRFILVKNAFTEEECYTYFDDFIQNNTQSVKTINLLR